MKKTMIFCILGIFLVSVTAIPAYNQTAEEIIQKMIEVTGGRKALESIDDFVICSSIRIIF